MMKHVIASSSVIASLLNDLRPAPSDKTTFRVATYRDRALRLSCNYAVEEGGGRVIRISERI